ncbi:MAG: hypothetical protein AB1502_10060 [Thermodesulfobacteriota bacterium]
MLSLFQLLLGVFAIYSAINFEEGLRLLVPLGCLFLMLIVSRVDKRESEKEKARKSFLKSEIEKVWQKESTTIKEQDFFTIDSLLWPKSELLLIDAVHFIFKDLGFKISAGINYSSVDRIVKIPDTKKAFGVEILMSEREVEPNHPKLSRALQFEQEKRNGEKILIIASTHTRLPLSERGQVSHLSKELVDFLIRHNISFLTAHHLYELWQKAKGKEIDIFGFFGKIYSQRGEVSLLKGAENFPPLSFDLPTP